MKKSEMTWVVVGAGVVIAGAVDLVIHREKIRRSMLGQEQHYTTQHRGAVSRLAHAVAGHTLTGRLVAGALEGLPGKSR